MLSRVQCSAEYVLIGKDKKAIRALVWFALIKTSV